DYNVCIVVTFHQIARRDDDFLVSSLRFGKGQVAPLLPQGQGLIRQTCIGVPRHMGGGQGCRNLFSLYLHAQWLEESWKDHSRWSPRTTAGLAAVLLVVRL